MKRLKTPIITYVLIFILWLLYRSHQPTPPLWVDNLIAKPTLWLIPLFFIIKKVEKNKISSLGLSSKNVFNFSIVGIITGALFFLYLKTFGVIVFHSPILVNYQNTNIFNSFVILIYAIATAITEELLFRGYLQTRLTKIFKSNFWGIGLSSVLFTLIHIPIAVFVYHYSIQKLLIFEAYLIEVSILYALHFMFSKSLTSSIAAHAAIDFLSDLIL